eukprot:5711204-Pyramimonas_sp.AAC.1
MAEGARAAAAKLKNRPGQAAKKAPGRRRQPQDLVGRCQNPTIKSYMCFRELIRKLIVCISAGG